MQRVVEDIQREDAEGAALIVGQAGNVIQRRRAHQRDEITKRDLLQDAHSVSR